MNRREFLVGLSVATPWAPAWGQSAARPPVVGFVGFASSEVDNRTLEPFRDALRERGHVEGRTIVIEARSSGGDIAKGHELISAFAALPVTSSSRPDRRRRARSSAGRRSRSWRSRCPPLRASPSCSQASPGRAEL